MKLNFFTPLPPLETEIAHFSIAVLRELSVHAKVRVWTSQATWDEDLCSDFDIRHFDPASIDMRVLNSANATFYNLGNNPTFHRTIFDVARFVPGIVILHDTHLPDFFFNYGAVAGPNRDYYISAIQAVYGDEAAIEMQTAFSGTGENFDLIENYPLTIVAVNTGIGSIVHNQSEYDLLTQMTNLPVYYLPLSFDYSEIPRRLPSKGERRTRLIMFGYIGSNRRLLQILIAISELSDRRNYVFDLYGKLYDLDDIEKKIIELDLGGIVRLHGFVPEAELNAALMRADLAINLRFPTRGEASGSQLRIWAAGLPALVTKVGWYKSLPPDSVFFVDPDREIEDIQRHLTSIRQDPSRFRAAGLRGRVQLEKEHNPRDYAAGLVKIAEEARFQHACKGARSLARDSADLLSKLFGVQQANDVTPIIAEAIHQIMTPASQKRSRKS